MAFSDNILDHSRPDSIRRDISLPRRQKYHPSPVNWRDEILYFLLVDRFSDERERPLLDRQNLSQARTPPWRWDQWIESGASRWQGGTLRGVKTRLGYLKRLGNRTDLRELVAEAHKEGLRIILDIIFNHSGCNWLYPSGISGGEFTPSYTSGQYPFGSWRGANGQPVGAIQGREDGVWPIELQDQDRYTRAGAGNLGAGDIDDPNAEHKRCDFLALRDFRLQSPGLLSDLAACYKYWIALTDCDGFRIDTLKHVSFEEARNFCGTVKEFANNLGKDNFFLVGEVAGGDDAENRYLNVLEQNLNAALDIGEMRLTLTEVAKGQAHPKVFFDGFDPGTAILGSHRNLGNRHVSILDDHDHVFGQKIRFSSEADSDHQVVAGVALQLFTLGIPCIYYGTEQSFAGPEPSERTWLPNWKSSDAYLREAMFGPEHPHQSGRSGVPRAPQGLDLSLPGFGPFGTTGHHCFDEHSLTYLRIAALAALREEYPALRGGRQYQRPISFLGLPFDVYGPGEIIAWSRILDDEEALCIVNGNGTGMRGADILVDAALNPPGSSMTVVLNTAQAASVHQYTGSHPVGSQVPVLRTAEGKAYAQIRDVPASEALVLTNHPGRGEGGMIP